MTIINTSPDRPIQLGYEGEDRVTVLRFRYGADWLENGEGIFRIRVRRHGEHTAYNAALVADDAENLCLLMTVTNTELSVKGSGEMQVVYSGADFVKKSPIYSYNVSRAVDEAVDPPAQDVYTQIIESLSGLHDTVWDIDRAVAETDAHVGNLADLTTTAKTDLVSAINEVNEHGGGGSVTVDDELSDVSTNPVQNKVITAWTDVLADNIQGLQTAVQGKADTQTVSALADAVNGLDSDVQGLQTSKADKSYVDTQLSEKASTQTVSDLADDVSDLQTGLAGKVEIPHTDEAKIAIQKMFGIYEAPWELINEETFTNETSDNYGINTDSNGDALELTDAILLFETPQQETQAVFGGSGAIRHYFKGKSFFLTNECTGYTQASNSSARGSVSILEQNKNMLHLSRISSTAVSNNGGYGSRYGTNFGEPLGVGDRVSYLLLEEPIYINRIVIMAVTGTGHYKLYGKRKWQ